MMATGHAVSGASLWLAGWSWTAVADLTEPRLDVLVIGGLMCAGAALLPDFDHPNSRLAHSGGILTQLIALWLGWLGSRIHAATKLDADRSDRDGHRTITHTFLFATVVGVVVSGIAASSDSLGGFVATRTGIPETVASGKLLAAGLVYVFVQLGAAAIRSNFGGRRRKVRMLLFTGARVHKATFIAVASAVVTFVMVPADVWWIGFAVGAGCAIHCLGDVITAAGCPVLWPVPIRTRKMRHDRASDLLVPVTRRDRETGQQVQVWQWRTWHLVGTPRWCRFPVGSRTETVVVWFILALGVIATAGLVYAAGPGAQV
jgi:membrane-bound metal-dependent hydrolase YbcI (DUF457 family)